MLHFVQISRVRGSAYNVSLAFEPPECQILKRLGRSNSCSYVSRKNCLCIRRKLLCMNKQVLYGYYISQILKQNIFYYTVCIPVFSHKNTFIWNGIQNTFQPSLFKVTLGAFVFKMPKPLVSLSQTWSVETHGRKGKISNSGIIIRLMVQKTSVHQLRLVV